MTYYKKSLVAGAICALACSNLLAQEAEFDLSSQRLEIQQVLPVPWKKIDHQGIIINPTPHKLTVDRNNMLDMTSGLVLKDKQDKFSQDLGFLTLAKKGVKLTIDFGKKAALKQGVKDNRVHIGLWANLNNYLKTRRKKNGKVTTYYIALQKLSY